MPPDPLALAILFLSTLSLRRATQITVMQATDAMPFLSTLSLRRATIPCGYFVTPIVFLSTLSLRRATLLIVAIRGIVLNFYPRSPCGERRLIPDARELSSIISIHALLAESDGILSTLIIGFLGFLSTLSLRRATLQLMFFWLCGRLFLSTLSLRRATVHYDNYNLHCVISIHALLAESDRHWQVGQKRFLQFLSTLSLRRATLRVLDGSKSSIISIHALLAESDNSSVNTADQEARFLSTLSLRRATQKRYPAILGNVISIHALLAESDLMR